MKSHALSDLTLTPTASRGREVSLIYFLIVYTDIQSSLKVTASKQIYDVIILHKDLYVLRCDSVVFGEEVTNAAYTM